METQRVFGRYQQQVWRDEDGLPQGTVMCIAQTPDGYLWIGTLGGLTRFDGVRFSVFDSNNTPEITSDLITALLADPAGNLWMATPTGLVRRAAADGRFTRYTAAQGAPKDQALCLWRDESGALWIGTDGGGLYRYREGRFSVFTIKEGLPSNQVFALAGDGSGGIWAGTDKGLGHLQNERFTCYTTADGLAHDVVRALCRDAHGALWIGTQSGGLSRFYDNNFRNYGAAAGLKEGAISTLLAASDGTLWVGASSGVYRMNEERFESFITAEGLPGGRLTSLYQSAQGDFWIGTDGGLSRVRESRFRTYTTKDGLANDNVQAIYQDREGSLWAGSINGLTRFKDGVATVFTTGDGLSSNEIISISEDSAGQLWVGTRNGVNCLTNGRFTTYLTPRKERPIDFVVSVYGDRDGNLFASTNGAGVSVLRGNQFVEFPVPEALARDDVLAIYEDRAGNLWFGGRLGGLWRLTNSHWQTWTTKGGAPLTHIRAFYEDAAGDLWIGTHGGGLSRWKDGKLKSVTARDGLFDNIVFQILPDDAGNLWMDCNRGIFRVRQEELENFLDGQASTVTSYVYGVEDGMPSRECNGANPAGWRTRDGHLFFPTTRGVVELQPPSHLLQPPHVVIEQIKVDRTTTPFPQAVRIQPRQQELEVQYTALSWNRPKQSIFKYQLVGLDRSWIDAGTRRTAYYSHLPPGGYKFQLRADDGDGLWSANEASLLVLVSPPFWLTWWFASLAAAFIAAAVFGAFNLRLQRVKRRHAAQENFSRRLIDAHESERRRIAAELHDGLGQSLAMIKNSAVFGARNASDLTATQSQLDQITQQSTHAISEVREIAYNLRPYLLDRFGLTKAINALLNKIAATGPLLVRTKIDNVDGRFPSEAEMSIYRIVQESINNVLKHADATEVEVTMTTTESSVQLEIRDNGNGFEPATSENGERGGFGLLGMAERVRLLGGTWTIRSSPGAGTTVAIALPVLGVRRNA
ncbi:MAG: hypothetical protein DLM52_13805 [Chthoniobacterales bacterium]|nr:MAG: hypothetical protein DLM52_13805 [Chthoniobacterales bacterium]